MVRTVNCPATGEPIAVIGTGCRFPGSSSTPSKLWDLLLEPRDLLSPLDDRFSSQGWYHANGKHHGHCNVKHLYPLTEKGSHSHFDAKFFGVNAIEANTMDPQMRLLLETVYEALEAAGQPIECLRGSDTAVYTGMMIDHYRTAMERDLDSIGSYHITGTGRAMMSNRLSYFFDWHGPSMTIDTACSSSLIAVHQAVMQLRTGQSRVAIAAGSNLLLDPADYVEMAKLEMLSPDGRSRMWDKEANGYARGEGVAAVVLKTLSAAEADGDHIECLIRETGTNQDGRTTGITMPSATAQAQLIRDCYDRAGLNLSDPTQRPQYFEAHGTGTAAGDPVEAEAIQSAFFPADSITQARSDPLFVGGIKTVIGHSESAAGLAGLIKASLALQKSVIPPNLLFNELSAKVEPFYRNLQIPTSAIPWPNVGNGSPRRASVNSFGFGGANAHAILENYISTGATRPIHTRTPCFIPFVFSAASETSLISNLAAIYKYLQKNATGVDLRDLALTLHSRRSRLRYGVAVAASSISDLCQKLEEELQTAGSNTKQRSGDGSQKPKILGIFTGQGAQSARMAAALIEQSEFCQRIIDRLEARLMRLPEADRPSWSLRHELLMQDDARIGQAALSQPLCTALQILHVELLRVAGIEFSAVVGHSSGEIGAAYCAGAISAEDAICIAYYRGLHSNLAVGSLGQRGAMIAVGTSFNDAQELCCDEEFQDRVAVAAVNSSTSVTISGDEEAVDRLTLIFADEGKFVRRLKVDKAYHSSHMVPCSSAYICALQKIGIQVREATTSWFSSVDGGNLMLAADGYRLQATYWNDNMVQPVLFMQAVEAAWKFNGPFDMVVEVGPHHALKGPTLQNIREITQQQIPYTGTHTRGENATDSFAKALGYLWTRLFTVDLTTYDTFLSGCDSFSLTTGLPSYCWDHEKEFWHESRYMKAIHNRPGPVHELLGHLTPDSTDQDMRWRNILSIQEMPWLKGHALQHQAVFPAAGYAITAIEAVAAMARARGLSISLIEVLGLNIEKALTLDSDDLRVETINSLTDIQQHGNKIEAFFKCSASPTHQGTSLTLHASGRTRVTLGDSNDAALPIRSQRELGLSRVDAADFYASLSDLDYQYSGPFRALSGLKRKLGFATGNIMEEQSSLLIHPAALDAAFQSLLLAHCAPNSGGIWPLHVPRNIQAVRVNPHLCAANKSTGSSIEFDCVQSTSTSSMEGDVELFANTDGVQHAMVQVEMLRCVPFSRPSPEDDKILFATTVWDVATPDADLVAYDGQPTEEQLQLARLLERMSVFYLRRLEKDVPKTHPARFSGPLRQYFVYALHILSSAKNGKLPLWFSQWDQDSMNDLAAAYQPYLHITEVKLVKAIGENIVDIATGRTQAIEIVMQDGMLTKMYEHGLGFQEHAQYLARVVKQIVHRHPQMNILEVGAGTGMATKRIFPEIGMAFSSYTYTDISSGFFETAQHIFRPQLHKMEYRVLDISKDIQQQGYNEHSYDLIVASAVIHATPNIQITLTHVRRLLKPGGFLVIMEPVFDHPARVGTIFGALPGWWLGADDGRTLSPCVDLKGWDTLLRSTGFSGCDTVTPIRNSQVMPMCVFVTQAVDDRVQFLRDPLSSPTSLLKATNTTTIEELVLLGGNNSETSDLMVQLKSILRHQWGSNIKTYRSLSDVTSNDIHSGTTILSLLDLEKPVFQDLNDSHWEGVKLLLQEVSVLLWVSSGRRATNPYANMMVGLLRSATEEIPTIDIQCFDAEASSLLDPYELAQTLLRLKAAKIWRQRDGDDSLLVSIEPELVRDRSAKLVIPRVIANKEMNDRYNSSRRSISTPASFRGKNNNLMIVEAAGQQLCLHQIPSVRAEVKNRVQVTHSLRSAIRVSESGLMHIVLGRDCESNDQAVALTSGQKLMIAPVTELIVPVSVPPGNEALFIALLAYQILTSMFLEGLSEGMIAMIHEPDKLFAAVLAEEAKLHGIQIIFTTTSKTAVESSWLTIHPMAPIRTLRSQLPINIAAVFDFSTAVTPEDLRTRLRDILPNHCQYHTIDTMFTNCSNWKPHTAQVMRIHARLKECVYRTSTRLANVSFTVPTLTLTTLDQLDKDIPHTIIDWAVPASELSVRVQPADEQIRFSKSKTYWLAGLSGSLGLLLCEWMIRHGAKYIAISSRNPEVEEKWIEKMRADGAVVKVFSCDITDKLSMSALYDKLESTLPAIGGVCQGAMVLEDTAIRNMSFDALQKVLRPKVEGSLNLDQLFDTQGSELEFFIFFSSASSIIGRVGQSNYAAANLFMTALAEQRRQRGQVASVMHIGPIFGVGYVHEQGLDLGFKAAANPRIVPTSEQEFCQHFAEAVLAGRSSSQSNSMEVMTGMAKFKASHRVSPLLCHYLKDEVETGKGDLSDRSQIPLKSKLAGARGREELKCIIREALLRKLSALFQTEFSNLEQAERKGLRIDEMGIDSLIAVELRSWFVNELQVNIPVLKILSGAAVADLVDTAVDTIPNRLVPMLDTGNDALLNGPAEIKHQDPEPMAPQTYQSDETALLSYASSQTEQLKKNLQEEKISSYHAEQNANLGGHSAGKFEITVHEHQPLLETSIGEKLDSSTPEDEDTAEFRSCISTCSSDVAIHDGRPISPCNLSTMPGSQNDELKQLSNVSLRINDERCLALSFCQSLFWFSAASADDSTNLNLTGTFRLTGELNTEGLKRAVLTLGWQHESLRTRYFLKDGQPMQGIMHSTSLSLEHNVIECENELAAYMDEIHNHVYDLERGHTTRLALVSMSSKHHFFIVGVHHLAMDGQSFFPLMEDMLQLYTHSYQRMTAIQYGNFSEKQQLEYTSGRLKDELAFWKSELKEMPPTLPILRLSSHLSRPTLKAYGNRNVDVRIDSSTKALIRTLCRRCRVTPFHFYLAVFRVLLLRYTGSGDFSIGIGDANRTEELMGSIGNFVNLLPLVFHTEGSFEFDTMLQETRSKTYASLENSRIPFQVLLNELNVTRSATTTPIFQAFMDYRLARGERLNWGDCQLDLLLFQRNKLAYDVAVDIIDNADADCLLTFILRDDLYSQADSEQLAQSYVFLSKAFAAHPSTTLQQAAMFDRIEIEEALNIGRGPLYESRQWGSTIIHRIDNIAQRHLEEVAVITENGSVTSYDEIVHKRVDSIAAELVAAGITTNSRVAVLQEPSPDWVSSILAVMRLGATYVPLDVGLPWVRLATIVNDCQPQAILVNKNTRTQVHKLECKEAKVVCTSDGPGCRFPVAATSDSVSAILYTSGSSGTPKGIVLTHQGMRSWLEPCGLLYGMRTTGEVVLQQSSQGFDMSIMQIFTALCFGGSVCLLPQKFRGDAHAISDTITRHRITHTYGTPSEYSSWLRYGDSEALRKSSWKTALVGGEPLATSVLKEFATLNKDDLRFHHMYGTTESTFCASVMELNYVKETFEGRSANTAPNYPVGIALPNYNLYILDEQGKPLPVGIQGEIYIGGAGVGYGYLNDAFRTAETFVPDPFATAEDRARGWNMMQKTGDLGRWSRVDHGALLIEGRTSGDTMVKLRGLRVDLQEVEIAILHAGTGMISEVIVSTRRIWPESPEILVAHVVLEQEEQKQSLQQLFAQLELPLYMRPALIITLDKLPITTSGKRDRKAVSTLQLPQDDTEHRETVWTSTEKRLKRVWEVVLHQDRTVLRSIDPETDFFHVGGTSLSLLPLRENIKREFGIELQLVDLFEASVLSNMAHRIEGQTNMTGVIDWDKETRLLPSMTEMDISMLQPVLETHSRVVILTGGSGYLGKALIHSMIRDPTVHEIHCLGVRNVASRTDMINLPKVTLYEGDLHQPRVGLSQAVIDSLFRRAHLIIHNGADISYMKTYQSIRQSNFLITKDLIQWSMPRMIPFHYISSAGLGNFTKGTALTEASVASTPPPTDGSMAYTACKWASERFLERILERYSHWPICVHRPTLISRSDTPQLDGAHNILGYARRLGAVPTSKGVARGAINVVQLDTVVKGVLDCAVPQDDQSWSDRHQRRGEVHFVNHVGKLNLPLGNMRKWALEHTQDGYVDFSDVDLIEIPLDEWIQKASEIGMHPTMGELLATFARHSEIEFPAVSKGQGVIQRGV